MLRLGVCLLLTAFLVAVLGVGLVYGNQQISEPFSILVGWCIFTMLLIDVVAWVNRHYRSS